MSATDPLPFWKPPPPTCRDLRHFGLLFAVLLSLMAAFLTWRYGLYEARVAAVGAVTLALLSLALPKLLTPFWRAWMAFVLVLGFVNSHLLLALSFFALVTPIGLACRLLGKDPLQRDFEAARQATRQDPTTSFWHCREQSELAVDHYTHQF